MYGVISLVILSHLAELRLRGLRPASVRTRRDTLCAIERRLGVPLLDADEHQISRWQASLERLSQSTRYTYTRELRQFYRWAYKRGRSDRDMEDFVIQARAPLGLPRPCPLEDVELAVETADARTAIWIMIAAGAGLRAGEISRLRAEHVHFDVKAIEVRDGKGGRDRTVLVGDHLLAALKPWIRIRGRLWNVSRATVTNNVTRVFRSLDMPWTTHSLRHTAGTGWLAVSGNILAVKEQLGHASLATTQVYTKLSPTVARAAADDYDAKLPSAAA